MPLITSKILTISEILSVEFQLSHSLRQRYEVNNSSAQLNKLPANND